MKRLSLAIVFFCTSSGVNGWGQLTPKINESQGSIVPSAEVRSVPGNGNTFSDAAADASKVFLNGRAFPLNKSAQTTANVSKPASASPRAMPVPLTSRGALRRMPVSVAATYSNSNTARLGGSIGLNAGYRAGARTVRTDSRLMKRQLIDAGAIMFVQTVNSNLGFLETYRLGGQGFEDPGSASSRLHDLPAAKLDGMSGGFDAGSFVGSRSASRTDTKEDLRPAPGGGSGSGNGGPATPSSPGGGSGSGFNGGNNGRRGGNNHSSRTIHLIGAGTTLLVAAVLVWVHPAIAVITIPHIVPLILGAIGAGSLIKVGAERYRAGRELLDLKPYAYESKTQKTDGKTADSQNTERDSQIARDILNTLATKWKLDPKAEQEILEILNKKENVELRRQSGTDAAAKNWKESRFDILGNPYEQTTFMGDGIDRLKSFYQSLRHFFSYNSLQQFFSLKAILKRVREASARTNKRDEFQRRVNPIPETVDHESIYGDAINAKIERVELKEADPLPLLEGETRNHAVNPQLLGVRLQPQELVAASGVSISALAKGFGGMTLLAITTGIGVLFATPWFALASLPLKVIVFAGAAGSISTGAILLSRWTKIGSSAVETALGRPLDQQKDKKKGRKEIWSKDADFNSGGLIMHAAMLAIVAYFGWHFMHPAPEQHMTVAQVHSQSTPIYFPNFRKPGGGGGGNHNPLPTTKGRLPKFSKDQLTPPTPKIVNIKPVLPVTPTLQSAEPVELPDQSNLPPNFGDPLAKDINLSPGPGGGGGMGTNPNGNGGIGSTTDSGYGDTPGGSGVAGWVKPSPKVPKFTPSSEAIDHHKSIPISVYLELSDSGDVQRLVLLNMDEWGYKERAIAASLGFTPDKNNVLIINYKTIDTKVNFGTIDKPIWKDGKEVVLTSVVVKTGTSVLASGEKPWTPAKNAKGQNAPVRNIHTFRPGDISVRMGTK